MYHDSPWYTQVSDFSEEGGGRCPMKVCFFYLPKTLWNNSLRRSLGRRWGWWAGVSVLTHLFSFFQKNDVFCIVLWFCVYIYIYICFFVCPWLQFDWEPVGALEMPQAPDLSSHCKSFGALILCQVWSKGPGPGEEAFARHASNCLARACELSVGWGETWFWNDLQFTTLLPWSWALSLLEPAWTEWDGLANHWGQSSFRQLGESVCWTANAIAPGL